MLESLFCNLQYTTFTSSLTIKSPYTMGIKIQINSLEALERLIGGETEMEIEIEIRSGIVAEFTKKHLKQIADENLLKSVSSGIKKEIEDSLGKWVKKEGSWGNQFEFKFNDETLKKFKDERDIINSSTEYYASKEKIAQLIQERVKYICEEWTSSDIERRIHEAADRKIKERLNLK